MTFKVRAAVLVSLLAAAGLAVAQGKPPVQPGSTNPAGQPGSPTGQPPAGAGAATGQTTGGAASTGVEGTVLGSSTGIAGVTVGTAVAIGVGAVAVGIAASQNDTTTTPPSH